MSECSGQSPRSAVSATKFTRGEKCIFVHIIVTLITIIILLIVYCVHLYYVQHVGQEYFLTRRVHSQSVDQSKYFPVGAAYLDTRPRKIVCNTYLLRPLWSLGPAHCVTIRTDPDMANWLTLWRIMYAINTDGAALTSVKRSIPQRRYDRDTFRNNIGLFEHVEPITQMENNKFPYVFDSNLYTDNHDSNAMIINWVHASTSTVNYMKKHAVRMMTAEKCSSSLSPIMEVRQNEFCVTTDQQIKNKLNIGAVLFVDSRMVGFFSCGDKEGKRTPFVILNVTHFQDWIENVLKYY